VKETRSSEVCIFAVNRSDNVTIPAVSCYCFP